ncbi:MAG: SDR family oxidoreductase [Anaerolineae bacterium]|jgi:uncharacterized protein YbjT (DUF2867 family)|nr:SDR family oxidoreductase [Anaerolineae bacterium]
MTSPILVTGAPGNVGTEVVRELLKRGAAVRVAAFDPASAKQVFGDTVEVVGFDFLRPETFAAAFTGVERMFLVRPPTLSNVKRDIAPALDAAIAAGVKHIVFLSLQGVENNRVVPHYKIEQAILAAGVGYTFLRASFFMQNLSTTHKTEIRDRNEIAVPVGLGLTSFIDVRDIAAVAALTLTEDGHADRAYTLTGPEALSYEQVAAKLSAVLGRTIRYTNPSIGSFLRQQRQEGRAFGFALVMTALYTITRFGNAKSVTGEVERLLGRPPISFDQFARDSQAVWQPQPGQ